MTGALSQREMHEQVLDSMDWNASAASRSRPKDTAALHREKTEIPIGLNLIDTPATLIFRMKFRARCLPAKAPLLVVDASQGVEAQPLQTPSLPLHTTLLFCRS